MQAPPEPTKYLMASNAENGSMSLNSVQPTFLAYPPPSYQMPQQGYVPQPTAQGQYGFAADGQVPSGTYPQWGVYQPQMQSSQNMQVNVVTAPAAAAAPAIDTQPAVIPQPAVMQMPLPKYLAWSIINFLCCCWPLGLAAIIYSAKVESARTAEEARRHSLTARNLNISATLIGSILHFVMLAVFLILILLWR